MTIVNNKINLKKAKSWLISFLLSFSVFLVYGQEHQISGVILDENQNSLPYASIALKTNSPEKKLVRGIFSNENGIFEIGSIRKGRYILEVTMVGYKSFSKELVLDRDITLEQIALIPDANQLGEVTITAQRKVLDRKSDRFVLDVGASTFQNSNVMEIFQATPFMQVQDDKISINGKSNIMVLIDNVQIPNATLSDVLNSMNGNDIDQIEFITTPGVRYDASVNAVINIHTKKAKTDGLTGNINGAYSKGEYGRGNIGANLTYRKDRWAVNGRYSLNRSDYYNEINGSRNVLTSQGWRTINDENTEFYDNRTHNGQISLEYAVNNNHHFALTSDLVRLTSPHVRFNGRSGFSSSPIGSPDSILTREQYSMRKRTTYNFSLNYTGVLDSLGKKVEGIVTYTPMDIFSRDETQYQRMSLPDGGLLNNLPIALNENPRTTNIFITQLDWELPFKQDWTLETGLKYTRSKNNSDTYQYFLENEEWVENPNYTFFNRFHEYISAGYVALQKKVKNTLLRAGLRLERTESGVTDVYTRNNTNLFPSLVIQQQLTDRYQVTLNYRKTINRPSFRELSPFRIYQDEYTLVEGNLNLQPTLSHIITLNGNLPASFFLELGYTKEKNRFMQLPRQEGLVTVFAPTNLDGEEWSANLSQEHKFTSWLGGNIYARGFHYDFSGLIVNDLIENKGFAWNFGISERIKLPAGIGLDASYSYYSPFAQGGYKLKSFNYARVALKKGFLDNQAHVTLAFNDIFKGQIYRTEMQTSNLVSRLNVYNDTRRISIGFTYNLGKKTVKEAKNKELGNEDVINRAN